MKNDKSKEKEVESERVLVHVRIRPFSEDELVQDKTSPIEVLDLVNNAMTIKKEYEKKNFSFDTIFPTNSKQKDIFEKSARHVIDSVLDGYNGTIFAYGQTGTGKTYTMVGEFHNEVNKGVIPRSFDYIFDKIKRQNTENAKYIITVAFIQIYLETLQDLLDLNNQVKIRQDNDQGIFLENCEWIKVTSTAQCGEVFARGEKNRVTACTKMNAFSSRSHALFICKIEKSFCDTNSQDHVMTKSMLYLVDLAGSERVTKTKASDMRLEEAKKINTSLLVLGNCIQSLTDPKTTHVSYRDSKLTRILQESLGGNAKTSLIVTISPSNYSGEESISSLYFGSRAMKVQNKPMINKTEDFQAQCFKLQEDYDRLIESYSKLKIEYDKLVDENELLKNSETYLDLQRKSIQNNLSQPQSKGNSGVSEKELEELKAKYAEELRTLEKYYKEVIQNKTIEYDKDSKKKNDKILRRENEIDILKHTNAELAMKVEIYSDNIKDLTFQNDDFQRSLNDLLIEKDTLTQHIAHIHNEKDHLQEQNNELLRLKLSFDETEQKKKNIRYAITQTEIYLENNVKEILTKLKINCGNTSSYSQIITDILKLKDTLDLSNTVKIKKMNDVIEQNTKEIEQLKASNRALNDDKLKIDSIKKEIQAKNDKEINQLKMTIKEMETSQQEKTKEIQDFQSLKKEYEKKMYDIENNNKLLSMNTQAAASDIKGLQNNVILNEKSLNKVYNQLMNDIIVYASYKKELKTFEKIFTGDLGNTHNNSQSITIFINKLKNQLQKIKTMKDNPPITLSPSFQGSQTQLDTKELITKLSESINEFNNILMSFVHSYTKLSKIFLEQFKTNKSKDENRQITSLESDISKKNETYMKGALVISVKKHIEKFSSLCYKKNVDDLIAKVNAITHQLDKMQGDEIIQSTSLLFEELIFRISSLKDEKQLEIELLNEKIISLLRELDLNKRQQEQNIPMDSADSQRLVLKNEEISRLNKTIEGHLTKIKALSCENTLLKSNTQNDNLRATHNDYSEKLENQLNNMQTEITQMNQQKNVLHKQEINDNIDKELKHKNEYYIERLNKNIKKK